jgi:enoyl-CoA hydratase/carnithine racemase
MAYEGETVNDDLILRSAGNHFCADADGGFQYFQVLSATCSGMILRVVRLPQPVVAEVKGIATAAGCQLVESCDLAVAADDATFATSGVNIGLFCSTPMVTLSRNVPRKLAMEMTHAKACLAGYQRLKKVIFGELPKTTTGKIRNNELRDLVRPKS